MPRWASHERYGGPVIRVSMGTAWASLPLSPTPETPDRCIPGAKGRPRPGHTSNGVAGFAHFALCHRTRHDL